MNSPEVWEIESEIRAHFGKEAEPILQDFRTTYQLATNAPIPQKLASNLNTVKINALNDCVCWKCLNADS